MKENKKIELLEQDNKKEGYLTDKGLEDLERQEKVSQFYKIHYSPEVVVDMLKVIESVLPKIPKPKEKIIIEKYLMGFTFQEISDMIGYKSKSAVAYVVNKHKEVIKETYEDEKAIAEMFQGVTHVYSEPTPKIEVEKDISQGRIFLESVLGFETFIYPFDIKPESYIITLKHEKYGTHKLSRDAFLKFVREVKEQFTK